MSFIKNNTYSFKKGYTPWHTGKTKKDFPQLAHGNKKGCIPWNKGLPRTEECKKKISLSKLGKKQSKETIEKRASQMRGDKHWNWQGGLTRKNHVARCRFQKEIQKQVFLRDDYTCQMCGVRGKSLHVDHIQKWAEYVEMRFCIDNCRTICRECHYKITWGKPMPKKSKWGLGFFKSRTLVEN